MVKVITYGSDIERISITRAQERMLRDAGVWPKDRHGAEMTNVEHGLHAGETSYTDAELRAKCIAE